MPAVHNAGAGVCAPFLHDIKPVGLISKGMRVTNQQGDAQKFERVV